ncbi:hypothetical protein [Streptomyces sp. NPDC058307]|uniref:hypothetical protein n=1 Tax=Streptomyces sp. NPDC058307 TaxID=3346439 RepID=UPI0036E0448E
MKATRQGTLTHLDEDSSLVGISVRTEVASRGKRVALLTYGARTVVLPGPQRRFAENKWPFVDDFRWMLPDLAPLKTVNGTTTSDLGGASLLDGSGTYAKTLHTVRRICTGSAGPTGDHPGWAGPGHEPE